jgi:hypothetical protein
VGRRARMFVAGAGVATALGGAWLLAENDKRQDAGSFADTAHDCLLTEGRDPSGRPVPANRSIGRAMLTCLEVRVQGATDLHPCQTMHLAGTKQLGMCPLTPALSSKLANLHCRGFRRQRLPVPLCSGAWQRSCGITIACAGEGNGKNSWFAWGACGGDGTAVGVDNLLGNG